MFSEPEADVQEKQIIIILLLVSLFCVLFPYSLPSTSNVSYSIPFLRLNLHSALGQLLLSSLRQVG